MKPAIRSGECHTAHCPARVASAAEAWWARFLLVFGSRPAIRQSLSGLLVSRLLVRESWSAAAT